ncbi:MAG: putative HTH-type transcriptional regulator [Humibacillus sp.]|nr:putative HTH-type transcriptional regulator [Humibacillus sp.]
MPDLTRVPEIGQLVALRTVERLGSISAAADELGVTQQAMSARVRAAERTLGTPVFVRSTHGVELTPAGQLVITWAADLLDAAAVLADGMSGLLGSGGDTLRVAASNTVSECLLPGWASALRAARPGLHVQVVPGNSEQVVAAVSAGEVDLGFVEGPTVPRGLSRRTVASDALVVVVPRDHPWARRRRGIRVDELAATPLVMRESGSGTRRTYDRAVPGHALPALELPSTGAVRDAVVTTGTPAVLSALAVRGDLLSGRLVAVPVVNLTMPRAIRAVWSQSRRPEGAAAELLAVAVSTGRSRREPGRWRADTAADRTA